MKVRVGGETRLMAGEGNGPVNALDQALRKALEIFYPVLSQVKLTDYKVRVLDSKSATAARVRVLITSTCGGGELHHRGRLRGRGGRQLEGAGGFHGIPAAPHRGAVQGGDPGLKEAQKKPALAVAGAGFVMPGVIWRRGASLCFRCGGR